MYWWKIASLKKVLSVRSLTEKETLQYLMADTVLTLLILIPIPGMTYNQIDVYIGILTMLIVAAGTYFVYRCNGGSAGQNFLQRFFAVGWVAGIRYTVFVFLPVFILYLLLISSLSEDFEAESTWIDAVLISLVYAGFFWVFGKHIKDVADSKKSEEGEVSVGG